jgi:hypothetical protein
MATELTGFWRVIDKLQTVGGVAAILAVGITATICARYLLHEQVEDVPPVLSNALSTILGFYFGSKARDIVAPPK